MAKIIAYNIQLEVVWDDGSKETVDASTIDSKDVEWFLDGLEDERNGE